MPEASAGTPGPGGGWVDLLAASRPISWPNTALPFAAAAYAGLGDLSLELLLGVVWFLLPYNLLLYGINDLHDYASDVLNPRKGSGEGALMPPSGARRLWIAILVTCLPLALALAWLAGPAVGVALLVTALVAWAYSAPPARTKERPFLDSLTSALHFVLPAVCGSLVGGVPIAAIPWTLMVAFTAWGVASHALGAVQDIAYDRGAGIASVATLLGARPTALLSLAAYGSAVLLVSTWGPESLFAASWLALYLLLPLMILARPDEAQARRAWRGFLGLNVVVGFVIAQQVLRAWDVTDWTPDQLIVSLALIPAGVAATNALLTLLLVRAPAVDVRPGEDVRLGEDVRPGEDVPDWLLLADPRTQIGPGAAFALLGVARRQRADLVMALARGEGQGTLDRALAAGYTGLLHAFVPLWLTRITETGRSRLPFVFAWGSLALVRREALAALPRRELDVSRHGAELVRAVRAAGGRVTLVDGADLAVSRHLEVPGPGALSSLAAAVEGWRGVLLWHAGDSPATALVAIIGFALAWLAPPLVALAGAAGVLGLGLGDADLLAGGLVACLLVVVARLAIARLQREAPAGALARQILTALLTPPLMLWGLALELMVPRDEPIRDHGWHEPRTHASEGQEPRR